MSSITALEKSFQNCSLNRSKQQDTSEEEEEEDLITADSNTPTTLELNSHLTLPHQWEQCLDLKTGEIYYINWEDGTKKKEDPRKQGSRFNGGGGGRGDCYYHYEEQEQEQQEEDKSYESDGSSSASSPCHDYYNTVEGEGERGDHILVVAGCKTCMMYFMLPKRVEECPKCSAFLLHFDRLENGSL